MVLNQHSHRQVGDNDPGGTAWNELVKENWDIAGNWELAGAPLSGLAAGTQLGACGWLTGVKQTTNFGSLRLAIPQRAHVQHLNIAMSGLLSDWPSVGDLLQLVFNDDPTASNYYYAYVQNDGVSEVSSELLGTVGKVRGVVSSVGNDAGCYGAMWMTLFNYRGVGPFHFSYGSIMPGRTSGAGNMYELGGGGAYWGDGPISSLTISPEFGDKFLCEGDNRPTSILDVYGIYGRDDL